MINHKIKDFGRMASSDRRNFMRKMATGTSALASPALMSTLLNLQAAGSAVADAGSTTGYKALVCVFLLGGNDSFNMLAPYGSPTQTNLGGEYGDYVTARGGVAGVTPGGLALPKPRDPANPVVWQRGLLRIQDAISGRYFGCHPGIGAMRNLYNEGALSFIGNVGSLVQPTTLAEYNQGLNLPLGLFSHSDLIRHWQTADPGTRSQKTGWGGRLAGQVDSQNTSSAVGMNISLNGVNVFQTGTGVVPYVVSPSGATALAGIGNGNARDKIYEGFTNQMIEGLNVGGTSPRVFNNLFEKTFVQTQKVALDAADLFNQGLTDCPLAAGTYNRFPATYLGSQLRMVAQSIAARETYGHSRQIFFVSFGSWDHHDEVMDKQATMLPDLSASLNAFYRATEDLGVESNVTTFTASDFARTLSSNGNGSDHAWGGNHAVLGGAVDGGKVFGKYPTSLLNPTLGGESLDLGRGRLLPTTAVDEYARELVQWFGVPAANLNGVLPNIGNFQGVGRPRIRILG